MTRCSVNKAKMRQMLDRLKKSMGQDDASSASFKLAETDEHHKKPAPKPAPAAPAAPPAPAPALKLQS